MNDFIGDNQCVTHHMGCDCREAKFKSLQAENAIFKEESRKQYFLAERYREALEKLSKLGNGDQLGNSDGNRIAQQALKEEK